MAAGENEAQPIILDAFAVQRRGIIGYVLNLLGDIVDRDKARLSAYAVDGLEASGGDQPGPRILRHAIARPLLERRPERIVQRFFGQVEVAEEADQCRENAARFGAID